MIQRPHNGLGAFCIFIVFCFDRIISRRCKMQFALSISFVPVNFGSFVRIPPWFLRDVKIFTELLKLAIWMKILTEDSDTYTSTLPVFMGPIKGCESAWIPSNGLTSQFGSLTDPSSPKVLFGMFWIYFKNKICRTDLNRLKYFWTAQIRSLA